MKAQAFLLLMAMSALLPYEALADHHLYEMTGERHIANCIVARMSYGMSMKEAAPYCLCMDTYKIQVNQGRELLANIELKSCLRDLNQLL